MFRLFVLPILLQIICIVHLFKTGKDKWWIYVILFIPMAGGIAYLIIVLIPSLLSESKTQNIQNFLFDSIAPERNINELKNNLKVLDTPQNKKLLADEYVRVGKADNAIELYESCLEGIHKDDIHVLSGLSIGYFEIEKYENAFSTIKRIKEIQGCLDSDDMKLLLALTFEKLNNIESAEKEFEKLVDGGSGIKYQCNYGLFLKRQGKKDKANTVFEQILTIVSTLPKFNYKLNTRWIKIARAELSR